MAIDASGTQVVAPPQHEAQPAAKAESAKPHEEATKPVEKAPAPAAAEEPKKDWKKWALYGGLAFGNLLILGLGYFAYRMIMGGGKSSVLDETDDEDDEKGDDGKKGGGKTKAGADKADKKEETKEPKRTRKAVFDLPDDAIDIEGGDDKKK